MQFRKTAFYIPLVPSCSLQRLRLFILLAFPAIHQKPQTDSRCIFIFDDSINRFIHFITYIINLFRQKITHSIILKLLSHNKTFFRSICQEEGLCFVAIFYFAS